jgi:hypothetical protein
MPAGLTGYEVKRLSNGQDDPKIEIDAVLLALRAWDALYQIGNIRLGPLIKLHVGVDGKGIAAGQAYPLAFTVGLHGAPIDAELILFANSAPDGTQTRFDLFDGYGWHGSPQSRSITSTPGTVQRPYCNK